MAKQTRRTNWFRNNEIDALSEFVEVFNMHDSSLVAYYIKDRKDIKTLINIRKDDPGEITKKYQPLVNNYAIYFLTGTKKENDTLYKTIYIGQASQRDKFKGLDRLDEHLIINKDGVPKDSYYYDWNSALYITNEENKWSTAKLDTLEKIFIESFKLYSEKEKCKVLNKPSGKDGNIPDQEYQLAVTLITELLSTQRFNYKIDPTIYTASVDEAIYKIIEQKGNEIKAETKEELKSDLSKTQLDNLAWAEQVNRYDDFKDLVSTSNNYILSNGRMPSGESFDSTTDVFTPLEVAEDMINLIPSELFSKDKKILCLYSKDGTFGIAILKRCLSDKTIPLYSQIPDNRERLDYVIQHMLYFTCNSLGSYLLTSKKIIDYIEDSIQEIYKYKRIKLREYNTNIPNVITINNMRSVIKSKGNENIVGLRNLILEQLESKYNINKTEEDKNMKFNLVIGNPPYNNDLYIDFVYLAKALSSKYVCMITPAKWQGKGGEKNEAFRKDIVPYMSNIVYYPSAGDLFDITSVGGITYFIIENNKQQVTSLEVKSNNASSFQKSCKIDNQIGRLTYSDNNIECMVKKVFSNKSLGSVIFDKKHSGDYLVIASHLLDDKHFANTKGGYITTPTYIVGGGRTT